MDADQNIVCLEHDYLLYLATHLLLLFLLLSLYLPTYLTHAFDARKGPARVQITD